MRRPRSAIPATIAAAAGAVLWFASGLLIFGIASTSSRWVSAIQLVVPPTVPIGTWQQVAPWNLVLPVLGALLFGGVLGLLLQPLSRSRGWRVASPGIRFLAAWPIVVVAAFVVAAVWALGGTIAGAQPTGFEWAFRSAQPGLLASGYFGLVWGWAPALLVALLAGRRMPVTGDVPDAGAVDRPTRPWSWSWWVAAVVVVLTVGLGVAVVAAQPVAERAGRIAAGGTPDGLPTSTAVPTPTVIPDAEPAPIAPDPVQAGANWCTAEQTMVATSGAESALGHRALTILLVNRSTSPCVVDGYPDLAFADADDHTLTMDIQHASSYTAVDPGATEVTLAPGATAEAHLGWGATGARTNTASRLWVAAYPGTERSPLAIETDLVGGSELSVTAWAPPAAG